MFGMTFVIQVAVFYHLTCILTGLGLVQKYTKTLLYKPGDSLATEGLNKCK